MEIDKLKIVHLYPKELNLYGDSGNLICLQYRLKKRRFGSEIIPVGVGDDLPDFDLLFIGGGQDREINIISSDLKKKGDALKYYIESGRAVLAICAGYQLLGEYYKTADGKEIKLSGVLPFYTVGGEKRMIGNCVFRTPFCSVVGFENHSGRTYLSSELTPLGEIVSGYGNNGEDKTEGAIYKNAFCTYAHGPVLPKNPEFADEIIRRMLKTQQLSELDDETENACHEQLLKRFRI